VPGAFFKGEGGVLPVRFLHFSPPGQAGRLPIKIAGLSLIKHPLSAEIVHRGMNRTKERDFSDER
jgi:hypothetical protein